MDFISIVLRRKTYKKTYKLANDRLFAYKMLNKEIRRICDLNQVKHMTNIVSARVRRRVINLMNI